jgi:LmbE family N-acetylglucosaminyl deacetylase
MLEFSLKGARTILCLGAHSDDIEIGCGGTMLKLTRDPGKLSVTWVVFSGQGDRAAEGRRSARAFLAGAGRKKVVMKRFRGSYFPYEGRRIKQYFEHLKQSLQPDLVFTHCRDDRHQDHRTLSDLTWNTFRNHLILEYEIPKYDGDLGQPNAFVRLDETLCLRKAEILCKSFQTQGNKHWFSQDTFLSLMRIRGIECASPTKYAEAFYCRKLVCG